MTTNTNINFESINSSARLIDTKILGGLCAWHLAINDDGCVRLPALGVNLPNTDRTAFVVMPEITIHTFDPKFNQSLGDFSADTIINAGNEIFAFFTYGQDAPIEKLRELGVHALSVDIERLRRYVGDRTMSETKDLLCEVFSSGNPQFLKWVYSPWADRATEKVAALSTEVQVCPLRNDAATVDGCKRCHFCHATDVKAGKVSCYQPATKDLLECNSRYSYSLYELGGIHVCDLIDVHTADDVKSLQLLKL